MKDSNEKLIRLVNDLVEINNDRIEGYERAAKETDESDLKNLFSAMASESRQLRTELTREVINLGGQPTEGTTTSGKFYRVWMDTKAALTGKDRKAILSSCEFGEDAALDTYRDALKSDVAIPGSLMQVITSQKERLQKSHDKIRTMRDEMVEH